MFGIIQSESKIIGEFVKQIKIGASLRWCLYSLMNILQDNSVTELKHHPTSKDATSLIIFASWNNPLPATSIPYFSCMIYCSLFFDCKFSKLRTKVLQYPLSFYNWPKLIIIKLTYHDFPSLASSHYQRGLFPPICHSLNRNIPSFPSLIYSSRPDEELMS